MTINGISISTYNAKQHKVTIGHAENKNNSEWISSALLPHLEASYAGFKQLDITFIVKGTSRETIILNTSKLLAALRDPCTLVLDGFAHRFKGYMKNCSVSETVMDRWHTVKASMLVYEYGTEVTASGTGSVSAVNPGTLLSPVELRITPAATVADVSITGLCRNPRTGADMPVMLETMTANMVIVLDGANGMFTEAGQLKADIDIKFPPCAAPGSMTVTCSNQASLLQLTILPLYM